MDIRPVGGALGAEVRGIDLSALDRGVTATVRALLREHLVVFFPDQHLSVDAHLRLGESLGDVVANSYIPAVDDEHPGVSIHRSEDGYVANVWHSDGQPRQAPVKLTIFKMVTAPGRGGDTMFANQHLVYERLSTPMREFLDGLTALQRSGVNPAEQATQPAVITHPETGRKLLYVNHSYTVCFDGMTEEESRPLLGYLLDHGHRPEFTCRFRWETGSIAFWDNRVCKHLAIHDAGPFRRVMRRTQLAGGPWIT
jgi:taurine dioxygenase